MYGSSAKILSLDFTGLVQQRKEGKITHESRHIMQQNPKFKQFNINHIQNYQNQISCAFSYDYEKVSKATGAETARCQVKHMTAS